MSRARQVANFDPALFAADEVSGDKVSGGTIGAGEIGSSVTGYTGIKEIDKWRLTTSIAGGNLSSEASITANLERPDTAPQGRLGTGMTESSGVFTFPSTGIWLVRANAYWAVSGDNSASRYNAVYIKNNASTYLSSCGASINPRSISSYEQSATCETVLDITDVSLDAQKILFTAISALTSIYLLGSTTDDKTDFTFIRIGDT